MSAAAPAAERLGIDLTASMEAFTALGRIVEETWREIAETVVPALAVLGRLAPHLPGIGRCWGPPPLVIDGHAYRRRTIRRRP